MDVHFQQTRHWNRHVSDNLYDYHHMIFADDDSDRSEPLVQALFDGDGFPYYESPFKGFICERFAYSGVRLPDGHFVWIPDVAVQSGRTPL